MFKKLILVFIICNTAYSTQAPEEIDKGTIMYVAHTLTTLFNLPAKRLLGQEHSLYADPRTDKAMLLNSYNTLNEFFVKYLDKHPELLIFKMDVDQQKEQFAIFKITPKILALLENSHPFIKPFIVLKHYPAASILGAYCGGLILGTMSSSLFHKLFSSWLARHPKISKVVTPICITTFSIVGAFAAAYYAKHREITNAAAYQAFVNSIFS